MNYPLPEGFSVAIDPSTRRVNARTLVGGSPPRILRLTDVGQQAWSELARGPAHSHNARVLGRLLTDVSAAHPRPNATCEPPKVTVVIPVRDRPQSLKRCLASLRYGHPIVIVDDASVDPTAVAELAESFGARLIRRSTCGGPAAARNTGLKAVETAVVAFLDSDCVCVDDWIGRLIEHFADPLVAAVAPRIAALPSSTAAGRFATSSGALDLGARECRVMPGAAVPYVPTAALLVRREAIDDIGAFDERLRFGEDVDLVWRLHRAGKLIRYQPDVRVLHAEPADWASLWTRRFQYGTSAAPLACRHPEAIAPLVLHPWPSAVLVCLLARRPLIAALIVAVTAVPATRGWRRSGVPTRVAAKIALQGVFQTYCAVGRYCTQFGGPLLLLALAWRGGTKTFQRRRRTAAAALLFAAPLRAAFSGEMQPDPFRFLVGHLADNMMYGAGVWFGCLRHRTLIPVRPKVVGPRRLPAVGIPRRFNKRQQRS
ncbi:mycofactocin biosynthesis glycosyltransferase MftF [Candidatus Mycolicibacterium alkanivorans]|uniref:Mycofactocin biosynthesis glycosyltransferase MftF n=1 Tax=Candidatus Mycolicibacterium alkanivorans TaxID=2954114 RepID=A0ABS9Z006_9MYCO|nr:mycofactocin biosynthesis glycosyltransferase MftF [Candidatus Mycolicibacterium alkanivorans]MCI4676354.1 mycofactocin biosynthesis glycosyltransferase MftF [Candidatus Mycolicibacterium alkanivorans]